MAIGAYRNRPCYCGSGKKLKKCHLVILSDARANGDIMTLSKERPEAYLNPKDRIELGIDK